MSMTNDVISTISKYDRLRGGLQDVALFTKPTTIQNVETITGKADTYILTTCRHEDHAGNGGDYIFIEYIDETGQVTRLALPPKAANAIASQRDSLTKRRRSLAGKRRAAEMTPEQKIELRDRLAKARHGKKAAKKKGGA